MATTDFDEVEFLTKWGDRAETYGRYRDSTTAPSLAQQAHRWLSDRYPLLEELARREGGSSMASDLRDMASREQWRRTIRVAGEIKGRIALRPVLEQVRTEGGPVLPASQLHPDVWSAARKAWEAGLHRQAVGDAATAVESMAKIKVGGAVGSGAKLLGDLFTLDPPKPGEPRLRFPDVDPRQAQRWGSAHGGARDFGQGCMEAIRNWAAHTLDEADEQIALEYLAALSVLARWVEAAAVEKAP